MYTPVELNSFFYFYHRYLNLIISRLSNGTLKKALHVIDSASSS